MNPARLQSRKSSTAAIVALFGLLVIFATTVVAQSGRRVHKQTVIPAATPESSPTPVAKKSPEKPALIVFLGIDARGSFSNIPLYYYDSVLKSCAERISGRSSIKVEISSRDMTRGEAVKRAKGEKEGYVVLLQLRSDGIDADRRNEEPSRVYVEYFVFAPITARQVASGKTYQQVSGYKDVIVGRTTGNAAHIEYRLKEAAREAGERILSFLAGREPR